MEGYEHHDFPEMDEPANPSTGTKKDRPFVNQLFPNDSITECNGFINEVRSHEKEGRVMYFVSVGLFQGSQQEGDGYKGILTNCDLLAGPTLEKWLATIANTKDPLKGIRFKFEIRNLMFKPKLYEGKAVLDSRGILETVQIGRLIR